MARIKRPKAIKRKVGVRPIWLMILITFAFLALFRLGAWINLPFVDPRQLTTKVQMFGFLDMFSGGALSSFSILALGISPYITASIVIQLLQMDIIPTLKEWSQEGAEGKRKLNNLTKYVALGLAFVQALLLSIGINVTYANGLFVSTVTEPHALLYIYLAIVATAGTAFCIWLADKISTWGVGNGTSLLIVSGILATFPAMFTQLIRSYLKPVMENDKVIKPVTVGNVFIFIAIILILLLIIVGIVFMEAAQRRIPIQYSNRPAAAQLRGRGDSNIPIKLNSASVIPVIFASTIMSIPTTIIQIANAGGARWGQIMNEIFSSQRPVGFAIYILLIFVFSFFYAFLQMNPEEMAKNLQKNNGYIPGVRPGDETASFVSRVLFRTTMIGATYLAIIASLPIIITWIFKLPPSIQIGGTGLIIVVGVAIETFKQLKTVNKDQQYKGFINE